MPLAMMRNLPTLRLFLMMMMNMMLYMMMTRRTGRKRKITWVMRSWLRFNPDIVQRR